MVIALALFATLITQAHNGKMSVIEGLSDHACKEAVCIATGRGYAHGLDCEQQAAFAKQAMEQAEAEEKAWRTAHPKEAAEHDKRCAKVGYCLMMGGRQNTQMYPVEDGDIETAQCVK